MMGLGHALSGVAVALASAGAATGATGHPVTDATHLAVFTAVTAGATVLPDIDVQGSVLSGKGGSTAARCFGRASMFVAEIVSRAGAALYTVTASCKDRGNKGGHRTITHTWIGCAAAGAAVYGSASLPGTAGRVATLAVLFVALGLTVRGLLGKRIARRGWIVGALLGAAGTALAAATVIQAAWPILGTAVGLGCLTHTVGDMLTKDGCPVLWPLPIAGRRWYPIGLLPRPLRFKAGGGVERRLVVPLLVVTTVLAAHWTLSDLPHTSGAVRPVVAAR